MKSKTIADIRHGDRVVKCLLEPKTFQDVVNNVSLDRLTVQKVLANLHKHGYIYKDFHGMWNAVGEADVEKTCVTRF